MAKSAKVGGQQVRGVGGSPLPFQGSELGGSKPGIAWIGVKPWERKSLNNVNKICWDCPHKTMHSHDAVSVIYGHIT